MRIEQIGDCTLYLADCMDVLPTLEKVDSVITDPPYSEITHKNAKSNRKNTQGNNPINFKSISFDDLNFIFNQCSELCDKWLISTMEWRHIAAFENSPPENLEFVRFGVWLKTNPMPQISADRPSQGWEGICYMHSKKTKKQWNGGGQHGNYVGAVVTDGVHPTGKPLGLFYQFVEKFTHFGNVVLDPFMGSGTTGVAAVKLGRKFIGIERDEQYFNIAVERIKQAYAQGNLFEEPKKQPEQVSLL